MCIGTSKRCCFSLYIYIYYPQIFRVAKNSSKNLMPVSNIGVCFGPTLMRSSEETISAIMDIKWCNIVIEVILENGPQVCIIL